MMRLFTVQVQQRMKLREFQTLDLKKTITCPFCKREGFPRGIELAWSCEICQAVVVGIEEGDCEACS